MSKERLDGNNLKTITDDAPTWKEAWGPNNNYKGNDKADKDFEVRTSGKPLDHQKGEESYLNHNHTSVEALKTVLSRDIDPSGLPSYEASVKFETLGYF